MEGSVGKEYLSQIVQLRISWEIIFKSNRSTSGEK